MTAVPSLSAGVPTIEVDGVASAFLESSLMGMSIESDIDGLSTCELVLANASPEQGAIAFSLFDRDVIDFGKEIVVSAGAGEAGGVVFAGVVSAITARFPQHGSAEVAVTADDGLQHLRNTRRTRVFEDMTDEDAIGAIAREHGLTAEVALDPTSHRVITQVDQSDLAFVRARARRAGAEVWLDGTVLHVAPRSERRTEPIACSYRQNLRHARLAADVADQRTHIDVGGWDPATKEAIDVTADGSTISSERAGDGRSGAEVVDEAFGERRERVFHTVPLGADDAQLDADGRFRRQARRFVGGEIVVNGDSRLEVGATVELVGLGAWFSGAYDVVGLRHVFELAGGFRTEADVERVELGR